MMNKMSSVRIGLAHDGVGYVSGVGMSKYWGVMARKTARGPSFNVAVREVGGDPRIMACDFELDESTAAAIAASFYECPIPTFALERQIEDPIDGRHVYKIDNEGRIRKYDTLAARLQLAV